MFWTPEHVVVWEMREKERMNVFWAPEHAVVGRREKEKENFDRV